MDGDEVAQWSMSHDYNTNNWKSMAERVANTARYAAQSNWYIEMVGWKGVVEDEGFVQMVDDARRRVDRADELFQEKTRNANDPIAANVVCQQLVVEKFPTMNNLVTYWNVQKVLACLAYRFALRDPTRTIFLVMDKEKLEGYKFPANVWIIDPVTARLTQFEEGTPPEHDLQTYHFETFEQLKEDAKSYTAAGQFLPAHTAANNWLVNQRSEMFMPIPVEPWESEYAYRAGSDWRGLAYEVITEKLGGKNEYFTEYGREHDQLKGIKVPMTDETRRKYGLHDRATLERHISNWQDENDVINFIVNEYYKHTRDLPRGYSPTLHPAEHSKVLKKYLKQSINGYREVDQPEDFCIEGRRAFNKIQACLWSLKLLQAAGYTVPLEIPMYNLDPNLYQLMLDTHKKDMEQRLVKNKIVRVLEYPDRDIRMREYNKLVTDRKESREIAKKTERQVTKVKNKLLKDLTPKHMLSPKEQLGRHRQKLLKRRRRKKLEKLVKRYKKEQKAGRKLEAKETQDKKDIVRARYDPEFALELKAKRRRELWIAKHKKRRSKLDGNLANRPPVTEEQYTEALAYLTEEYPDMYPPAKPKRTIKSVKNKRMPEVVLPKRKPEMSEPKRKLPEITFKPHTDITAQYASSKPRDTTPKEVDDTYIDMDVLKDLKKSKKEVANETAEEDKSFVRDVIVEKSRDNDTTESRDSEPTVTHDSAELSIDATAASSKPAESRDSSDSRDFSKSRDDKNISSGSRDSAQHQDTTAGSAENPYHDSSASAKSRDSGESRDDTWSRVVFKSRDETPKSRDTAKHSGSADSPPAGGRSRGHTKSSREHSQSRDFVRSRDHHKPRETPEPRDPDQPPPFNKMALLTASYAFVRRQRIKHELANPKPDPREIQLTQAPNEIMMSDAPFPYDVSGEKVGANKKKIPKEVLAVYHAKLQASSRERKKWNMAQAKKNRRIRKKQKAKWWAAKQSIEAKNMNEARRAKKLRDQGLEWFREVKEEDV